MRWLESNVQIMLCHSTHSISRIFVPWVSSVALNASSQVQLAYWGPFHSFGRLVGKNMRNRQDGEGAEDVQSSSFCLRTLWICISLGSFNDHLVLPHRLDLSCRVPYKKLWLTVSHIASSASETGTCVTFCPVTASVLCSSAYY